MGCDGTVVTTEHNGRVIRNLEIKLEQSLQWFICILHHNTLLLRQIMLFVDGQTKSLQNYAGPVGKANENCELLKICHFRNIVTNNFPTEINHCTDLSADQALL